MLLCPVQVHRKRSNLRKHRAVTAHSLKANAFLKAGGLQQQQRGWCEPLKNFLWIYPANVAQPHVIVNALAKSQAAVIQH